jgi:hypothetical protein
LHATSPRSSSPRTPLRRPPRPRECSHRRPTVHSRRSLFPPMSPFPISLFCPSDLKRRAQITSSYEPVSANGNAPHCSPVSTPPLASQTWSKLISNCCFCWIL